MTIKEMYHALYSVCRASIGSGKYDPVHDVLFFIATHQVPAFVVLAVMRSLDNYTVFDRYPMSKWELQRIHKPDSKPDSYLDEIPF